MNAIINMEEKETEFEKMYYQHVKDSLQKKVPVGIAS
jgi:hypothetical protein